MLTNPRAERVKAVRALGRRSSRERAGRFVAEGPQAVREVLAFRPETVIELYVDPEVSGRRTDILELADKHDVPVHECSADVMTALADTEHPQGLLAVCRPVDVPLTEALSGQPRLVVVLTNVRDPGNAGTVIRAADAVGADAVLVSDASVDIYNPKVVRSTVGSLWHLPVVRGVPVPDLLEACRAAGLRVLAADGQGEQLLPDTDLQPPHAWVMGNEAWGLEPEVLAACDEVVRVPIYGHAESLNLAMAATVCLYASAEAVSTAAGVERRTP
ncbi:TrmH family RNA methyltransferase [Luteipulveratus mongoliensis]|uniref:RNA methyltransferase n=1 Tax=Luteipulveratus mongoliensis TaxID=571913 RepID=A0A0K1JIZ0_9MICO|nr:RNA methyltransferase [Luteipulveratus mongoliensis]AKU16671.1 RNA methyltransferase [Luteipulveratus mongoliensis]